MKQYSLNATQLNVYKAKLFYKFLQKNGCLREFVEEIEKQYANDKRIKEFYHNGNILQLLSACDCNIKSSFVWFKTKRGHEFWEKLSIEFRDYWWEELRKSQLAI